MKPLTGTIYEEKSYKKGSNTKRFVAEINYKGQRIRKRSVRREVCEEWLAFVKKQINEAINDRTEEVKMAEDKEQNRILTIVSKAKLSDLAYKASAQAQGLEKSQNFQTYIIYNPFTDLYKIGKSKDLWRRLKAFCMPELELIAYIREDMEKQLHRRFNRQRQLGEWFRLSEDDLWELSEEEGFIFLSDEPGGCF